MYNSSIWWAGKHCTARTQSWLLLHIEGWVTHSCTLCVYQITHWSEYLLQIMYCKHECGLCWKQLGGIRCCSLRLLYNGEWKQKLDALQWKCFEYKPVIVLSYNVILYLYLDTLKSPWKHFINAQTGRQFKYHDILVLDVSPCNIVAILVLSQNTNTILFFINNH